MCVSSAVPMIRLSSTARYISLYCSQTHKQNDFKWFEHYSKMHRQNFPTLESQVWEHLSTASDQYKLAHVITHLKEKLATNCR